MTRFYDDGKKTVLKFDVMSTEESEEKTGRVRKPWDGYGLMILRARLGWIRGRNPKIYRIYDPDGNLKEEVNGDYNQVRLAGYKERGWKVERVEERQLIAELEESIRAVERRYYSGDADKPSKFNEEG